MFTNPPNTSVDNLETRHTPCRGRRCRVCRPTSPNTSERRRPTWGTPPSDPFYRGRRRSDDR